MRLDVKQEIEQAKTGCLITQIAPFNREHFGGKRP